MRKIFLRTIVALCFLTILAACVDNTYIEHKSSKENERLVSFVVNIAGSNPTKTRALTESDENTVKTIEVLLFDRDGKYTHQPIFSNNIIQKSVNEIAFTIKVPEGTFNMIILANTRKKIISILTKLIEGMSKESVLDLLITENYNKWNVIKDSDYYEFIPMSGDIPTITIKGDNTSIKGVILVRMLSKIDVNIATDIRKYFNLTSVHLYNNTVKGKIVPDPDSWDKNYARVLKPSIPNDAQNPNLGTALVYNGADIEQNYGVGVSCLNTIYTFEANKGMGNEDMSKNTCLVIGGRYENGTKDTYYRIDFVSAKSNNKDYLPLLRNHQYRVHITDIKGPGFDDTETALQSRPVNIEASIVEWDDGDITNIVFDGQYLLGVSQREFLFTKEKRTTASKDNDLHIITDYPSGWKASKITNSKGENINWLKLNPASGGTTKTKTKILLDENKEETERVGLIYITAGRLSHIVKITQSMESELYLNILNKNDEYKIDGLDFISIDGEKVDQQEYSVVWRPLSSLLYYQINNINETGIIWDTSNNEDLDDITNPTSPIDVDYLGYKKYKIRPMQFTEDELKNDPFIKRSQVVIYGISDGNKVVSKPFLIRHIAKNIIDIVEDSYNLDGGKHQFYVRSNMAYNIKVGSNDQNVLKLITTQGKEDTSSSGYPIKFELVSDIDGKIGNTTVTLILTSPSKEFKDKEIVINCISNAPTIGGHSNSYLISPNAKPLLIPVSRCNEWVEDAFGGGFQVSKLGENEEFFAHLIWTDNKNGIASNSVLESVSVKGKGLKGFLVVKPGSAEGNAVVAIKNTKGEVLWSWHIWNTTYSPTEKAKPGDYMDRNLGALVASISDRAYKPDTYGLLYQWGRKDPFPASKSVKMGNNSTAKPLYDKDGNIISAPIKDLTKVLPEGYIHNNLHRSILNPNIFYFNTDSKRASGDWFTSFDNEKNNNLWKSDEKSIYDPCPEGWRVPNQDWSQVTYSYYGILHQYTISSLGKLYIGGLRSYLTGQYDQENLGGFYWTSNPGKANTFVGGDSGQGGISYKSLERATGAMMRCIRE